MVNFLFFSFSLFFLFLFFEFLNVSVDEVCCRQGVDEGEACGISPAQVACFDVWKRFNRQKAL